VLAYFSDFQNKIKFRFHICITMNLKVVYGFVYIKCISTYFQVLLNRLSPNKNMHSFINSKTTVRPLPRPRHRWEDNINMDLQEVGLGGITCIDLAQDRDR
jgi:hypothetical protein